MLLQFVFQAFLYGFLIANHFFNSANLTVSFLNLNPRSIYFLLFAGYGPLAIFGRHVGISAVFFYTLLCVHLCCLGIVFLVQI